MFSNVRHMAHGTRVRMTPDERRAQLLDLGATLMATRPLEELTIELLAEEAGISRGLMYHYFGSKQEFHRAVVEKVVADIYEITGPRDIEDPVEQLAASLGAYVDFVAANYAGYVSLVRAANGGDEELRTIYLEARRALTDRIFDISGPEKLAAAGVLDTPGTRLLVDGWAAMTEDVTLAWVVDDHGVTRDELLDQLAGIFAAIVTSAGRL